MPIPYNSATTMFVYLKGHHVLEYYFGVLNARLAANDRAPRAAEVPPIAGADKHSIEQHRGSRT